MATAANRILRDPRTSGISAGLQAYLLTFPVLLLGSGLVLLALARKQELTAATVGGAGLFAVALLAAHVWVRKRLPLSDPLLLPIAACLASLGQLMSSRLEPSLGPRQGTWVLLGLGGLAAVSLLPSAVWLRRYRYTWALLAVALLAVTLLLGSDPNGSGARLWILIAGVSFQPTELVKLLLVVFMAAYLDDYHELLALRGTRYGAITLPPLPYLAPILGMAGVAIGIFVLQRDLGPALLFTSVLFATVYAASGRASDVAIGVGLLLVGGVLADRVFGYVHTRVLTWLDPWAEAQGSGYQLVQALYALASGGIFGTGLDFGSPRYIPAVHTDFVIAAIGEELGLVGSLAVVALYVLLVARGFRVALRSRLAFNLFLATGLTCVLGFQALIILAGALKLIPLTGITLPFISYGGSSVLANFVLVGLLLLISHEEEAARG